MLHDHRFVMSGLLASVALCACATNQGLANDSKSVAQIRSAEDLEVYLKTTPNSPLDYMSPVAKQDFLSSLVFTERGLGSFQYSDLKNLPPTQVYQILSLFGTESAGSLITEQRVPGHSSVFEDVDVPDYACSNVQAACVPAIGAICMSNCAMP